MRETEEWILNAKGQSSSTCAKWKHTFLYVTLCFVCELLNVDAHKLKQHAYNIETTQWICLQLNWNIWKKHLQIYSYICTVIK
jgi:hypothetical protein